MYDLNKCLAAKACWKHWNGNSAMYNISILSKINSFTDGWDEQFVSLQLLQQRTAWSNTYYIIKHKSCIYLLKYLKINYLFSQTCFI